MHSQFEYGLAVNIFISSQIIQFENTQEYCLRSIFGDSWRSLVNNMLQLVKLPTMKERINILQAQSLLEIHKFHESHFVPNPR